MHTERRHELESNTLRRELTSWSDRLRPYTSAVLVGIAALLGIFIIASLWNNYQATRDQSAWDDYQMALFQGDVENRALQRLGASEDHAGTEMQEWAMMAWADRQLLRAAQQYLTRREEANDRLTDIIGTYEQFADGGSRPEIRNRARLGLARAYEMKNDLKEARKNYERVEGALAELATQRLKQLESKQVEETAAWLATVTLPKSATAPGPGTPGARPGFEATTPPTDGSPASGAATPSMEEILGGLGAEGTERYGATGEPEGQAAGEATSGEPAAADDKGESAAPESKAAAELPAASSSDSSSAAPTETPAAAAPAAETPAEVPAEQPAPAAGAPAEQ